MHKWIITETKHNICLSHSLLDNAFSRDVKNGPCLKSGINAHNFVRPLPRNRGVMFVIVPQENAPYQTALETTKKALFLCIVCCNRDGFGKRIEDKGPILEGVNTQSVGQMCDELTWPLTTAKPHTQPRGRWWALLSGGFALPSSVLSLCSRLCDSGMCCLV